LYDIADGRARGAEQVFTCLPGVVPNKGNVYQSRRLHLISEWRWRGSGGAGFAESTAAWADINKEADRSFVSEDPGRLDQGPE
jgi:hypothetical protein